MTSLLRLVKALPALALLFSAANVSTATVVGDEVPRVARFATFEDVPHTFTLEHKWGANCPEKIEIMTKPILKEDYTAEIKVTDVKEDGHKCRGANSSVFTFVPETKANSGNFLVRMGFPMANSALKKNPAARFIHETNQDSSHAGSLLIGFIEGGRNCGELKYSKDALWFFSKMPGYFNVRVYDAAGTRYTNVNIPPRTRALVVTDGFVNICVLTDKTTIPMKKVEITDIVLKRTPSPSVSETPSASSSAQSKATPVADKNITAVQAPSSAEEAQLLEVSPIVSPIVSPVLFADAGYNVCFSADASLELENGLSVPISELRIGDRVRTGNDTFSDVFMFSHRDRNVYAKFVHLDTSSALNLTLTPSHYLYSNGKLVAAGAVKVGDKLSLGNGTFSEVVSIKAVTAKGLYNPHTLDGNIVVDGVITSTFTASVHPMLAHGGLLAPLRSIYHLGKSNIIDIIESIVRSNGDYLSHFVPEGPMRIL